MPKLIAFTPCQDAAVDAFTNRLCLFFVMDSVQPIALRQAPAEMPADVRYLLGPFTLVSQWWREDGEEEGPYEQSVLLRAPDGHETVLQPETEFVLERPIQRILHQTPFVGLRMAGPYHLQLRVRPRGETEWVAASEYPFLVEEVPQEQPAGQPSDPPAAALTQA